MAQGHGGHELSGGGGRPRSPTGRVLPGSRPSLGVLPVQAARAAEPLVWSTVKVLELSDVAVMTYESAAEEVTTTVLGSWPSRIAAGPVVPVQVQLP